jgi:NagD protein
METDIIAGIEAEVDTVLVLSGVTSADDINNFAYRPSYIFSGLDEVYHVLSGN